MWLICYPRRGGGGSQIPVALISAYPSIHAIPGGVRTLIALHHGRKTKSESFASCGGREHISGGSEIA